MIMKYNPNDKYCSSSPDVILGCNINFGCYLHDRHYRNERENRFSRKDADILLRDIIYRILKTSNVPFELRLKIEKFKINILFLKTRLRFFIGLRKRLAFLFSRVYYYAVRIFAKRSYING